MHINRSDHLRPEFTGSLTEYLSAGQCINLISPHGQGRRRTLHDLSLSLPLSMQIISINISDYYCDYKGFYKHLSSQIKEQPSQAESFNNLLDHIEMQNRTSLLILHNFDLLRHAEGIDTAYDAIFFQALNSITERQHIALLCVSESTHTHYRLQADGSELSGSHLDALSVNLPPITTEQIKTELQRRHAQLTRQQLDKLASSLICNTSPYSALEKLTA